MKIVFAVLGLLLLSSQASAQTCPDGCRAISDADMKTFLGLAAWESCRDKTPPTVTADPVTIIVDRQGRIFGSGTGAYPFQVHLNWCNYDLTAKTELTLKAAMHVEPAWGFRLRLKATAGVLLGGHAFKDSFDGGLLVDFFHVQMVNSNAYVGVRSFGVGVGVDLTTNFGIAGVFALGWGSWSPNALISAYFGF